VVGLVDGSVETLVAPLLGTTAGHLVQWPRIVELTEVDTIATVVLVVRHQRNQTLAPVNLGR